LSLKKKDTVLVTGALGSVGRAAVYYAKRQRARVIAGVRTKQKEEAASLAANGVIGIDSTTK
jgi:NADPH:quinone reductase-like Zn-dependent oxidoreductase